MLLLVVAAALIIMFTVVRAIPFTINTDDGSVSDWVDQGIPIFQTDLISDTIRADEDIVNAWVATTPSNDLAFLVQMASGPALDGDQYRAIVASLDCDYDSIDREADFDKIVYYFWESDLVATAKGDGSFGSVLPNSGPLGQRINEYLEWKVGLTKISDCLGDIQVKFYSMTSADAIVLGTVIDDKDPLKGWSVPTVVNIKNVNVKTSQNFWFIIPLGVGIFILGAFFYLRKK